MGNVSLAKSRADGGAGLHRTVQRPASAAVTEARRPRPGVSRFAHYTPRPLFTVAPTIFGTALVIVLTVGWMNRDEEYLVPDSGAGY